VHHVLRDRGCLIKVPPSWRELHARGRKLQSGGGPREAVAERLGVIQSRWEEIERACGVGWVAPTGICANRRLNGVGKRDNPLLTTCAQKARPSGDGAWSCHSDCGHREHHRPDASRSSPGIALVRLAGVGSIGAGC
jgi:hypothetical protein